MASSDWLRELRQNNSNVRVVSRGIQQCGKAEMTEKYIRNILPTFTHRGTRQNSRKEIFHIEFSSKLHKFRVCVSCAVDQYDGKNLINYSQTRGYTCSFDDSTDILAFQGNDLAMTSIINALDHHIF